MSKSIRLGKVAGILSWIVLMSATPASARTHTKIYNPVLDEPVQQFDDIPGMGIFKFLGSALDPLSPLDVANTEVVEKTYDQKLNPADDADARTFKQRYFILSSHADGPASPVIFYVCGEAECDPRGFLGRFAEEVAKTFHAHLIALEHRYYGKSVPFESLTSANLQYLSTDNAIADLARFQTFAMSELGYKGKWISIGGSYPGSLSAYYRLKHPELVVGALASSAPVQAKNAFEEYDSHVTQVLGEECSAPLRKMLEAAEAAMAGGRESFQQFKTRFDAADIQDDTDFFYILADTTADAVQYGYPEKLCNLMKSGADPVESYSKYVREFLKGRKQTAVEFSPEGAMKLGAQESDGMRQWSYQSCKEYGYWQDAHHDPKMSVRSPRINGEYDREYCNRLFGVQTLADEAAINARYYQPLQDPAQASHILFTNGSDDPWSELSITAARRNDTNPNTAVYLVQGKAHCSDLRAMNDKDPETLKNARKLFLDLAADWLK